MFKFSNSSLDNMRGVNAELQLIFHEALKISPIDFGIPSEGGLRTAGEQNQLFQKGVSKCDGITNKSNHQSGNALDFYAYVGKASWNKQHLAMIAGVILSVGAKLYHEGIVSIELRWGGTFGSSSFLGWDYPHMEVKV
jgi:peptidoglycan L-alanyl-D-glutamate endopeptidase CwlK